MKTFLIYTILLFVSGIIFLGVIFSIWVYSRLSYPLKNRTSNSDYDSYLQTSAPRAMTESSGVAQGDNFYLLGGLGAIGQSLSSLYCYNNKTKQWQRKKDIPYRVNHVGFVASETKLYAIGGFKPLTLRVHGFMFANWKPRNTFMIFDPAQNEWEQGPDMPFARGAGGVCFYDSAIYYAGGINEMKQISDTFFKFDLKTNKWEVLPPVPTPRDHLRMEVVDGILYAISGRKDDMRYNLACVEAFDLKTGKWNKKANISNARGGFGSTVFNGKIYTFGGESVWSCFDIIEEYDPVSDSWRQLHPLPHARHGICAGVIGNEIHLVSGGLKPRISISKVHRVIKIK